MIVLDNLENETKMELFNYLKNFAISGTFMSSSSSAINKLITEIRSDRPQVIVELGGGSGKTTRQILSKMSQDSVLYCFEIQSHFVNELDKIEDSRLRVINDSATNILKYLDENAVDIIISTLPLSFFKREIRSELLINCHRVLKQDGSFKQLSFLFFPRYFKNIFDNVITELKIIDMPPAVLYLCTKTYRR